MCVGGGGGQTSHIKEVFLATSLISTDKPTTGRVPKCDSCLWSNAKGKNKLNYKDFKSQIIILCVAWNRPRRSVCVSKSINKGNSKLNYKDNKSLIIMVQ